MFIFWWHLCLSKLIWSCERMTYKKKLFFNFLNLFIYWRFGVVANWSDLVKGWQMWKVECCCMKLRLRWHSEDHLPKIAKNWSKTQHNSLSRQGSICLENLIYSWPRFKRSSFLVVPPYKRREVLVEKLKIVHICLIKICFEVYIAFSRWLRVCEGR